MYSSSEINKLYIRKDLISLCITMRYEMEMLVYPIMIIMPTPLTNGMQQVICIYTNQDVLPLAELLYHMIRTMQLKKRKKI